VADTVFCQKWAIEEEDSDGKGSGMRRQFARALLVVTLIGAIAESTPAAVTELQAPTPLPSPPRDTSQPMKVQTLTSQQEAALVEVRKILREAREVTEGISIPLPVLSDRHRRKALERAKNRLLNRIEEAQLQAGDVTITSTLTAESRIGFKGRLALAQARYGFTNEAVQTVSTETVTGESLLVLVEALVQSGDIPTAIRLAETQLPKDGVQLYRQKHATAIFSYIAEEQHKAGDLKARETLNRAVKERPSSKFAHTTDYIYALISLGRAQAALGDKAASAETFKQAIEALSINRKDRNPSSAFMVIAKAQGETGDRVASEQTFQRAIELRTGPRDLTCLAWAQAVTGQREAALQSFKLAIDDAEKLPLEEQRRALSDLVPWQLKIGDREGALETVERARRIEAPNVISLAGASGNWRLAHDLAITASNDDSKAAWLLYIARTLVKNSDPFGTPELFKKLAEEASPILEHRPPQSESKTDVMYTNIAELQAVAGDISAATETIKRIIFEPQQSVAYGNIVKILIGRHDLPIATQIASNLKDEWRPSTEIFGNIGTAYGKSGETAAGLSWVREQRNPYEKAYGLLGLAQGLLKQHGIEKLWHSELPRRNFCPDMSQYD
jgi:tetratricopeptide (TPR) repeat protein